MPVYNSEKYLAEAIESILRQTYSNFEFLVFDDGSADNSLNIIRSFNDPRISIFHSPINVGYVKHLNQGIDLAKGKYIVRMDADDVAYPRRLAEQINFMEHNPEFAVCGTWVQFIGDQSLISKPPTSPEKIKVDLLNYCPLYHPSTIIRRSVLEKYQIRYKNSLLYAEDHGFWVEISKVAKLVNLPKVLLKYRIHHKSVTATKWLSHQKGLIEKIKQLQYESLLDRPLSNLETLYLSNELTVNRKKLKSLALFIKELQSKNQQKKRYHSRYFRTLLLRNLAENIWLELEFKWHSIQILFPLFSHFPAILVIIVIDKRFYGHLRKKIFKKW